MENARWYNASLRLVKKDMKSTQKYGSSRCVRTIYALLLEIEFYFFFFRFF